MDKQFNITIGDDPEYEDLIAEILFEDQFLAIVSQEAGYDSLDIEIQPRKDGQPWKFKLKDFEDTIQRVKKRLWELRRAEG